MKPERGAMLAQAILVSLDRWQEDLALIQAAPGSEAGKRHLLCSLAQAQMSLRQMIQRDSNGETS